MVTTSSAASALLTTIETTQAIETYTIEMVFRQPKTASLVLPLPVAIPHSSCLLGLKAHNKLTLVFRE
jgi:hypothetical protein